MAQLARLDSRVAEFIDAVTTMKPAELLEVSGRFDPAEMESSLLFLRNIAESNGLGKDFADALDAGHAAGASLSQPTISENLCLAIGFAAAAFSVGNRDAVAAKLYTERKRRKFESDYQKHYSKLISPFQIGPVARLCKSDLV